MEKKYIFQFLSSVFEGANLRAFSVKNLWNSFKKSNGSLLSRGSEIDPNRYVITVWIIRLLVLLLLCFIPPWVFLEVVSSNPSGGLIHIYVYIVRFAATWPCKSKLHQLLLRSGNCADQQHVKISIPGSFFFKGNKQPKFREVRTGQDKSPGVCSVQPKSQTLIGFAV